MNDRNRTVERAPPKPKKPSDPPNVEEGQIHHILDKGLPPGIEVEDAKDPGSQSTPAAPTDDRS